MTDTFISYSRRNADFAKRLIDRLNRANKDSWVDWEGIPLTAPNWWAEIRAGIEAADNFIFIMSPASMASVVCNLELDYAIDLKKRIVPLVYEDVESREAFASIADFQSDDAMRERLAGQDPLIIARDNWQHLSHINWLFFRDSDDFDAAFVKLLTTIETDLEYVKAHTRYLNRATEWQRENRRSDLLLFGEDIARAEAWLAEAEGYATKAASSAKTEVVNPLPQDLHRAYIQASRQADKQRRRIARTTQISIAALVLALVISGAAAFVITRQAQEQVTFAYSELTAIPPTLTRAVQRADQANTQVANLETTSIPATLNAVSTEVASRIQEGENRIESLRLAAVANTVMDQPDYNAQTAALVGIRALASAYTVEADNALLRALEHVHAIRRYTTDVWWMGTRIQSVWDAVFSPDGSQMLTDSFDERIRLWDVDTGELLQVLEPLRRPYAFTADGDAIVGLNVEGSAILRLDPAAGVTVASADLAGAQLLALSADGCCGLVRPAEGSGLRLIDAANGAARAAFPEYTAGFFSDNSRYLVLTSDASAEIVIVETATVTEMLRSEPEPGSGWVIALGPDARTYITTAADQRAILHDAASGAPLREFSSHTGRVNDVAFSPDGRYLLTASEDYSARIWDIATGRELRRFTGHGWPVNAAAFSPDGQYVLTASDDSTAWLWDADLDAVPERADIVDMSADGRWLLASAGHDVRIVDATTYETVYTLSGEAPVLDAAFSPDAGRILVGYTYPFSSAVLYDIATGAALLTLGSPDAGEMTHVAFSPDGASLLTVNGFEGSLQVWDAVTGEERYALSEIHGTAAFSPDGQTLGIANGLNTGKGMLVDAATGHNERVLVAGYDIFYTLVAFTPDGQYALISQADAFVRNTYDVLMYDVDTAEQARQFTGHTGWITDLQVSAQGDYLLTQSEDGTIRVWDMATAQQIRSFTGFASALFETDGAHILLFRPGQPYLRVRIDIAGFLADACGRMLQDLSETQRQTFMIADSAPTCPQFAQPG